MARKRRGLGSQGLDAILSRNENPPVPIQPEKQETARKRRSGGGGRGASKRAGGRAQVNGDGGLVYIPIDSIEPSRYQPRATFDTEALAVLTASIRNDGLLQPLVVRPAGKNGKYELIAGERRWRAAQECRLKKVPALVRAVDEQQAAVLALVENLQREDLSPLEEAAALEQLVIKFELSHRRVAESVGRSRSTVTNLMRLLKLGPEARELLRAKRLEMGHARALLNLPHQAQADIARIAVAEALSVRETERLVARWQHGEDTDKKRKPKSKKDPDTEILEKELSETIGSTVKVQHGKRGGKVLIKYANLDEFDQILAKLRS